MADTNARPTTRAPTQAYIVLRGRDGAGGRTPGMKEDQRVARQGCHCVAIIKVG